MLPDEPDGQVRVPASFASGDGRDTIRVQNA